MKLVTRAELMEMPIGTIFRRFEPLIFCDDWHRFEGVCGPDFFESVVGPHVVMSGYYGYYGHNAPPEFLATPGVDPNKVSPIHLAIDDASGREGLFEDSALYVVLDGIDVLRMMEQLTTAGLTSPPRYYVLPD